MSARACIRARVYATQKNKYIQLARTHTFTYIFVSGHIWLTLDWYLFTFWNDKKERKRERVGRGGSFCYFSAIFLPSLNHSPTLYSVHIRFHPRIYIIFFIFFCLFSGPLLFFLLIPHIIYALYTPQHSNICSTIFWLLPRLFLSLSLTHVYTDSHFHIVILIIHNVQIFADPQFNR